MAPDHVDTEPYSKQIGKAEEWADRIYRDTGDLAIRKASLERIRRYLNGLIAALAQMEERR